MQVSFKDGISSKLAIDIDSVIILSFLDFVGWLFFSTASISLFGGMDSSSCQHSLEKEELSK